MIAVINMSQVISRDNKVGPTSNDRHIHGVVEGFAIHAGSQIL